MGVLQWYHRILCNSNLMQSGINYREYKNDNVAVTYKCGKDMNL
jgi:hypothetical protein